MFSIVFKNECSAKTSDREKKKLTDLLMDPKSKQPVCKGKNESVNKKATVDMSL